MKRVIPVLAILLLIVIPACQTEQTNKQYFEESPEIEVAKKAVEAFLSGDMERYMSFYSDTAILWHNEYHQVYPGVRIKEKVKSLKPVLASMEYYYYEGELWEMVVLDNGEKWVHFWANYVAKYKEDNVELKVATHIDFGIIDGKIQSEAGFWDNLPFYLAEQRLKEMNGEKE